VVAVVLEEEALQAADSAVEEAEAGKVFVFLRASGFFVCHSRLSGHLSDSPGRESFRSIRFIQESSKAKKIPDKPE
jgi:hypothetical protein